MEITRATADDAAEILALQKAAYHSEAEIYGDFRLPPLVESLEDLRARLADRVFLKAVEEGSLVGSVRGFSEGSTVRVERLIVRPERQNRGIGSRLLREIEVQFPAAQRFELFTGHKSARNLHLYQKLGYRVFKRERVHDRLDLLFLEKCRAATDAKL
jgi:ribosomal protein S18 acetylase RimI-like enzyme